MKNVDKTFSRLYKYIIAIMMILIIITSIFLIRSQNEEKSIFSTKPRYHFYYIGQNSVDPFWKEVKKGIEDAGKQYDVVVGKLTKRHGEGAELGGMTGGGGNIRVVISEVRKTLLHFA